MSLPYEPCYWKTEALSAEFKPVYKEQLPLVRSDVDQEMYKSKQRTLLDAFAITLTSFLPEKELYNEESFPSTLNYTENIDSAASKNPKDVSFQLHVPCVA